jgi:hypothetical protein
MSKLRNFDRRGQVVAADSKYTGEEPVWPAGLSLEDHMTRRGVMLQFYNYYLDKKALMPDFDEWMKREMPKVKIAAPIVMKYVSFTVLKVMRANNRGMPLKTDKTDDMSFIKDGLRKAQSFYAPTATSTVIEDATPAVVDVPVKTNFEVHEVLCDLELMYDKWSEDEKKKAVMVNLGDIVKQLKIKNTKEIVKWLDKNIDELSRALNKEDEYAIEGYSFLSKPQIRQWVKILGDMKDSLKVTAKKGAAAARKKKVKTPGEQTKNLNYLEECEDTKVKTLPVSSIIGAQMIVIYNAKYRDINVLHCKSGDGFTVKGQAVQDVADKASYAIKLRNPESDLGDLKASKTPETILKSLSSKPKKFNPRFNNNTIVIYAK